MSENPQWRVLLIGGSSGTGKTKLAQRLSLGFGISVIQVDDIRLAIQAVTDEKSHPTLNRFVGPQARESFRTPESMLKAYIEVAQAIEPATRAVMSHHLDVPRAGRVIIEGDGLLPRLGSTAYLRETDPWFARVTKGSVRAMFLCEDDPERIGMNMDARGRGFRDHDERRRESQIYGSWKYGQYLYQEAQRFSVPVIRSRPYESLAERVDEVLAEPVS